MDSREMVVPAREVNEIIGIRPPTTLPPSMNVNLRKLNVVEPDNPAYGEWVDRHAVLDWLRAWEEGSADKTVSMMIRQYREVMGL